VKNNQIFINKLWNACRFVDGNITHSDFDFEATGKLLSEKYEDLMLHEKWILSKVVELTNLVTESMENYSFSDAGQELYSFTKNRFCDYYIEEFKLTTDISKYGEQVIRYAIGTLLKLWHPYIPFVTEELYNRL
jgi:valyl-tRNA synthetase